MNKKGFTLIEVIVALAILGIVSLMICSTVCVSKKHECINMKCMEMTYLSEMIIENLKANKCEEQNTKIIYNSELQEIINLFKINKSTSVNLYYQGKYDNYKVLINKREKSTELWEISVLINNVKVGVSQNVEIEALIPSQ